MLAPGLGEELAPWAVWLTLAGLGSVLFVLFLVLWSVWGGKWKRRSLVLAVLVPVLWVGYRVESEPRWHVSGLSSYVMGVFDETSEERKFPLNTHAHCPNPTVQISRFRVGLVEGDFGLGEDAFVGAAFVTAELAAVRLEDDGWVVQRGKSYGASTVPEGALWALYLQASRDGDFLTLYLADGTDYLRAKSEVFADECMTENPKFWRVGFDELDVFEPDN